MLEWKCFTRGALKREKMLLNRIYKIAAVYEQICSRPRILPPLFIHSFPRQLRKNSSLFFYFCVRDFFRQREDDIKTSCLAEPDQIIKVE